MCIYMNMSMYLYVYVSVYVDIYVCMHVHVSTCVCMWKVYMFIHLRDMNVYAVAVNNLSISQSYDV